MLPESERAELYCSASDHLEHARAERENYYQQCEEGSKQWKDHCENYTELPYSRFMHYSFDYAQQIHYPFECAMRLNLSR